VFSSIKQKQQPMFMKTYPRMLPFPMTGLQNWHCAPSAVQATAEESFTAEKGGVLYEVGAKDEERFVQQCPIPIYSHIRQHWHSS
jgi:hypothetical protein